MNKKVMKLASRGKRLGAYCLDKIVPFVLLCIVVAAVARMYMFTGMGNMYGFGYGFNMGGNGFGTVGAVVSMFVVSAVFCAYFLVQVYFFTKSKTIGKAILGLQVISSADGKPIGVWKMLLREVFAKKASAVIFGLGYLWILIDDKNRGWHDKIVETYVVDLVETDKLKVSSEEKHEETVTEDSNTDKSDIIEERFESITEEPVVNIDNNIENEVQNLEVVETEGGTTVG